MRYLLLCIVAFILIAPDIFAQDTPSEPDTSAEIPASVTQNNTRALPIFEPLSQAELSADGGERPGWLDVLTIVTVLLTVGVVASVAINLNRKKKMPKPS
jgi:hypothetical protein